MDSLPRMVKQATPVRLVECDQVRPRGHYSIAAEHGGLICVSGILPIDAQAADPAASALLPFPEQVVQVLKNLLAVLESAGSDAGHVMKVSAFIVGVEHWAAFNTVYANVFGEHRPARSVVPVPELHNGYLIEVEAIAVMRALPHVSETASNAS